MVSRYNVKSMLCLNARKEKCFPFQKHHLASKFLSGDVVRKVKAALWLFPILFCFCFFFSSKAGGKLTLKSRIWLMSMRTAQWKKWMRIMSTPYLSPTLRSITTTFMTSWRKRPLTPSNQSEQPWFNPGAFWIELLTFTCQEVDSNSSESFYSKVRAYEWLANIGLGPAYRSGKGKSHSSVKDWLYIVDMQKSPGSVPGCSN